MKLWYCMAEIELVVAAEEQPDHWTVNRLAQEEARDNDFSNTFVSRQITKTEDLPPDWTSDCQPRSEETDDTIGEILAANEAAERERLERAPLPGQMELPIDKETP
jgi:hypothetical protein